MKIVSGLLAHNKQQFNLTLDDGSLVAMYLEYNSQQLGWFFDLTWGDGFAQSGLRLTNGPNLLRQFRNQIPFGLGVLSEGNVEPTTLDALSDGSTTVYLLSQTDVAVVEFEFFGGPVVPVQPTAISSGGGTSPILPASWGPAGGDLSGTYPNPFVVAAHFGGTRIPFGAVADGEFLKRSGSSIVGSAVAPGSGDVVGPASAVDNHLALFNGTTGKLIKDGGAVPTALPPSGTAGGDLSGTYPNPTLGPIITPAGPIGDGTHVAQITVDAKGRVTAVASVAITTSGTGDVVGPASAVNGHFVLFNGTTGKLIEDGGAPGTAAFQPSTAFVPIERTNPAGGSIYSFLQKNSASDYDTRWRRPDIVNVCDYPGVDPTGATDSTIGLNAAIADLALNNGCYYFPPGKYKTGSGINFTGYTNLLVEGTGAELFAECGIFTVSSLTHVTTLATLTTSAPHGLGTGASMTVRGAVQGAYNGSFTITVTSATTFTYVMGSDPGSNATGTIKTCANVQTMVIDKTSANVRLEGIHFTSNASTRGDGIHLRVNASNFIAQDCTFEGCSGFGAFAGESVTVYQTNVLFDSCIFINTIGDGLHVGGVNGIDIDGCVFDGTGDDSIGIIGYEAFNNVVLNVNVSNCVIRNMQNAGLGSGCGIRLNMVSRFNITGCDFDNIAGPAVRLSDSGTGHTTIYNDNGLIDGLTVNNCVSGVEGYWLARVTINNVRSINCPCVEIASWQEYLEVTNCRSFGSGVNSLTVYVPPATGFAGRSFDAHWGPLIVSVCTGASDIGDPSNAVLYMDTNAAFDFGDLVINGCSGNLVGGGAWIVYKGIAAGRSGKITNNTNVGNTTITNGGGTAATLVNNN